MALRRSEGRGWWRAQLAIPRPTRTLRLPRTAFVSFNGLLGGLCISRMLARRSRWTFQKDAATAGSGGALVWAFQSVVTMQSTTVGFSEAAKPIGSVREEPRSGGPQREATCHTRASGLERDQIRVLIGSVRAEVRSVTPRSATSWRTRNDWGRSDPSQREKRESGTLRTATSLLDGMARRCHCGIGSVREEKRSGPAAEGIQPIGW